MQKENLYKFISIVLIILAFLSYCIGFYFNENSGGAGSYLGDFRVIWNDGGVNGNANACWFYLPGWILLYLNRLK